MAKPTRKAEAKEPPKASALRAVMQKDAAAPAVSKLDVAKIRALVSSLDVEYKRAADLTEQLESTNKAIKQIEEVTLPALMDEAGVPELVLDKQKIVVSNEVYPNVKKEVLPSFLAWLRKHKFGALIKNQVVVSFGMGEDAKAVLFAVAAMKKKLNVDQKQSVHPSTLKSWVKEQQEKKAPLPAMLDVNPVRRAEVKLVKGK